MIGFLARRMIDAMERHLNSDMRYLRALQAASPRGFHKFLKATALSRHREVVPIAASHAARLTSLAFEDCGPCVQIAVDQARAAGMTDAIIRAILAADTAPMPEDVVLAYRFARSILTRSANLGELREAVRDCWGDGGVVDLTMATQGSRLYPMLKLGLGFAETCHRVRVGAEQLAPTGPTT
ncbi:hypothetical protein SAMN05444678_11146 [Sphingomonas sp. YR710]|jgi:hypothetical protein|uniref:hypothetical protein n=1 Tax=Sphingomonas sp. YR710 TaxID=1882773 RepID=UPI00087F96D6|nr:hypothetical protein [Sphingomonas sp. YR710]SDD27043.1 hypothetical protein SAMN05444678_11146 [Sphingomonas sp. YR710]